MGEEENEKSKHKDENENEAKPEQEKVKENEIKIHQNKSSADNVNLFLVLCIIGVTLGILLEIINVNQRNKQKAVKKYWVYYHNKNISSALNRNGQLKHVFLVLERNGYELGSNDSWDLLWAHDYPFTALKPQLTNLKPNQRVNHFPSSGFITSKVHLATTDSIYIPKSFKLPKQEKELLEYASKNKDAMFLEKNNMHRQIYLKNLTEIDLKNGDNFVQEYVTKPFLVDGHKFDIGVYVAVTSFNPLRLYWYKGDVLFRYCPKKYHPFDAKDLDKYVIGDDYLPTWQVPSLAHYYLNLGLSMKDSFDLYAESQLQRYPSSASFFEMMRLDLIVDEDLRVHLLEANMSPNLSSSHFPQNQLLYEQVLYNLFSLVGISNDVLEIKIVDEDLRVHLLEANMSPNLSSSHFPQNQLLNEQVLYNILSLVGISNYVLEIGSSTRSMVSDQKNIAVFGEQCSTACKDNCQAMDVCALCRPCMVGKMRHNLLRAHREFLHKGDFRRLFPPTMKQGSRPEIEEYKDLSITNKLQYIWYQGKCNSDVTWCH